MIVGASTWEVGVVYVGLCLTNYRLARKFRAVRARSPTVDLASNNDQQISVTFFMLNG